VPVYDFSTNTDKMTQVLKVALGENAADLAIINGDIVNVYTSEVMPKQTVLIKGNCIAYVGNKAAHTSFGPETKIINAEGKTLIPGLIDGHTHSDEQYLVGELVNYAIKGSTTTIITETAAIGSLLGYKGIIEFIKMCRNQCGDMAIHSDIMQVVSPFLRRFLYILLKGYPWFRFLTCWFHTKTSVKTEWFRI